MDIQGSELEALKGADQCLQTAEALLLEVSFRRIYVGAPLAEDVIGYCASKGYRIYDICSYDQRPGDGALFQADLLFMRKSSRVFQGDE
jgi:hypothetical protein